MDAKSLAHYLKLGWWWASLSEMELHVIHRIWFRFQISNDSSRLPLLGDRGTEIDYALPVRIIVQLQKVDEKVGINNTDVLDDYDHIDLTSSLQDYTPYDQVGCLSKDELESTHATWAPIRTDQGHIWPASSNLCQYAGLLLLILTLQDLGFHHTTRLGSTDHDAKPLRSHLLYLSWYPKLVGHPASIGCLTLWDVRSTGSTCPKTFSRQSSTATAVP